MLSEYDVHVAVVGLGFGRAFAPIYRAHPAVRQVTVCDPNADLLREAADEIEADGACLQLDDVLRNPEIAAVHLLSPLLLHFEQTKQILDSGKHCACAVTMGMTLDELGQLVSLVRRSGLRFMMMETAVYTREFLFAQAMQERDELGQITFLRADYFQDLEAPYPDYWRRVPPMLYATHAVAPLLSLAKTRASKVSCLGGGRLRSDIGDPNTNPFPMQTAIFRLEGHDAAAQVNRAWYQTAKDYVESFSVYGDRRGFEWQQFEHEDPVVFELEPVQNEWRWRGCPGRRTPVPYRPDLLPPQLQIFADGGHGGSHPHLVHEFVSSIVESRPAAVHEGVAADWCAAGICANESSLRDGEWVEIPRFD